MSCSRTGINCTCIRHLFNGHSSRWSWHSQYQNISIPDFIVAKDDGSGGDNWSYKTCKAPVKPSPPKNLAFYMPDSLPATQQTVQLTNLLTQRHTLFQPFIHHIRCFCLLNACHLESLLNQHVRIPAVADLWESRVCVVTLQEEDFA